jgi:hypothetical protein
VRHAPGIGPLAGFIALALATFVAGAGCVYDWDLGTPAQAGADAGGVDAGGDAAPSCDTLVQKVEAARLAAKACTLGAAGQCAGSIVDACECVSFVKDAQSPEASAFAAAVSELASSNCPAACSGTCMPAVSGTCLLSAGMGPYCSP